MKLHNKLSHIKSDSYHNAGHMLTIPNQPIPYCEEYGEKMQKVFLQRLTHGQRQLNMFKLYYKGGGTLMLDK